MTTDGIHAHPALTTELSELRKQHEALAARVSKLEAPTTPTPAPAGYSAVWPVLDTPRPPFTHNFSDLASLRDVARNGGYRITLPGLVRNSGDPLEVGPDTIITSEAGCTWTGQGIYVVNERVILDNITLPTVPTDKSDADGIRVFGSKATNVMLRRLTIPDAGDECVDIWDGSPDASNPKRVVVERCNLGGAALRTDNRPWSLIAGGVGSIMLGLYGNVLSGGFRNPFINGNVQVYESLNWKPRWGIQAGGYVNGARAYIERNYYGFTGYHWARAHEPNNTGSNDQSAAIRLGSGNVYMRTPPRTLEWNSGLVAAPSHDQVYRRDVADVGAAMIPENAGAGTPR